MAFHHYEKAFRRHEMAFRHYEMVFSGYKNKDFISRKDYSN
ncbi:MAG: hypothetical protein WC679_08450 [Bacteroidales bacterium]|jgi:hypothetical protein